MFRKEQYRNSSREFANQCRGNLKRKFDRFFNEGSGFGKGNQPYIPVNISENNDFYQVQVYAAGREKNQFQVNITDQILTIKGKESEPEPGIKYIYQEQQLDAFERAFHLKDEILIENVHASFEDGILTVILQKDPSKIKAAQEVPVA